MSARLGLAAAALALLVLGLASFGAPAQERERRCYFGECPDQDSPQLPPPRDYSPPDTGPDMGYGETPDTAGDLPHYCCTVMGPLGPYPNPGPYGVALAGSLCSGMAMDGLLYQGATCYGDEQRSAVSAPVPNYCCTQAGRFGPFPNPGWPEGSACWSQTLYGPLQGLACY
jgi:hypothetical protein